MMKHFDWNQTFSSCLIFMDDHHLLSEWIAYHYFALPLGYLIIAVDPASKDPQPPIDDYWHTVMTIEIWNDKDFMQFPKQVKRNPKKDGPEHLEYKHVLRQRQFYKVCGKHLRDKGRTLTTFHDTDEYITVSNQFQANLSETIVHQPGHVWDLLQTYRRQQEKQEQEHENNNNTNTTTTASSSLSKIYKYYSNTCFHMPRALYSTVESTEAERNHTLPAWMDAKQFETLRYRYRLTPHVSRGPNKARNGMAKVIVDVSQLTNDDLIGRSTPHSPFKPLCTRTSPNIDYGTVPVGIHHYLGPWEFYNRDNDPRKETVRTRKNWEMLNKDKAGADDEIRPWIHGCIHLVGTDKAKYLLRNAGLVLKNHTK